jgi:DNA-directed RNA polymerase subunit RPC12/RpoP
MTVSSESWDPLHALGPDRGSTSPARFGSESSSRCPVCRMKVVVKLPGEIVIHNAILRIDSMTERVSAKCPRCKSWVEVPLRFLG